MHGRETMPCAALSGRERVAVEMLGRYLEAGPGVEGRIGWHVMPRYFFNISDDNYSVIDREGMELPNQKSAESHAIALAQTLRSRGPTPLDVVIID